MEHDATVLDQASGNKRRTHGARFAKGLEGRKTPIRGLGVRHDRICGRLREENPITDVEKTQRVPLVDKAWTSAHEAVRFSDH